MIRPALVVCGAQRANQEHRGRGVCETAATPTHGRDGRDLSNVCSTFDRVDGGDECRLSQVCLIACFVPAIDSGWPVLTGVRAPYDKAWADFHGGCVPALVARLRWWLIGGCLGGWIA